MRICLLILVSVLQHTSGFVTSAKRIPSSMAVFASNSPTDEVAALRAAAAKAREEAARLAEVSDEKCGRFPP